MNTLHPTDALVLANANLAALCSSARAQEEAAAATRRFRGSGRRWLTRVPQRQGPSSRNVRQNTSDRPSEVFCPSC